MSAKFLIVQFVYFLPSAGLTDFRLCDTSTNDISDGYPTLHRLVIAKERSGNIPGLIRSLGCKPWQNAISKLPAAISRNCAVVRAIVWTFGEIGLSQNVLESYALAGPAEDKDQPKASFWVIDPEAKVVLDRHLTLVEARAAHERILDGMQIED